MEKALRIGYITLAALLAAGFIAVLAVLVFDLGVLPALALLGVADVLIVVAAWRFTKRIAAQESRERTEEPAQQSNENA